MNLLDSFAGGFGLLVLYQNCKVFYQKILIIMGKVAKLVSPEKLEIAEKNGIPKVTVYKRLDRGWDIHRAITEPTKKVARERDQKGEFISQGKGKSRTITLPEEWDEFFDEVVESSQLNQSEWISQLVVNKLKRMKKSRSS